MAHVAGDEDAGDAGPEVKRIAVGGPSGRAFALEHQVLSGNYVALGVALDHAGEPISVRDGAGVNQQSTRGNFFGRTRLVVLNGDGFGVVGAFHSDDAGIQSYFDILRRGNLVFEIL